MVSQGHRKTFIEKVSKWRAEEKGASEAAAFIILFPFLALMVFALIEVGVNFAFRGQVDNIVQNVTRGVVQDGGVYWERTSGGAAAVYANGWEGWGNAQLQQLCNTSNRCNNMPTVTCSVPGNITANPGMYKVAPTASTQVTCSTNVAYRTVTPLGSNPVMSLGFNALLTKDISISASGTTTVGANS